MKNRGLWCCKVVMVDIVGCWCLILMMLLVLLVFVLELDLFGLVVKTLDMHRNAATMCFGIGGNTCAINIIIIGGGLGYG